MPWALLLVLVAAASAQVRPTAWPITSLAVKGNAHYSEQQILTVAGLKLGQRVTAKDFEAARDRLGATGAFEKIDFKYGAAPDRKGYAVSFEVFEAGPFFPVHFEDLPAPPEQLREALRHADPLFSEKIPATEQVLNRYVRALEEFLRKRGQAGLSPGEKVAAKVVSLDSGEEAVVFLPAAAPPAVAQVRFTGNEVIPTSALANAISGVAIGMPFKEARFRQLLETNLRPLYEARGRVRVAFAEIRTEPAKDVKGLVVTVRLEEGASYKLGQVRLESPVVAAAELAKLADLRAGDVANFEQVQAALGRLERRHRSEGYMKAAARAERQVNDQRRTVDLVIHLEPGPQYTFGKLAVQGLDIHAEDAVRKLWVLKEGQRFNADYPDHFLERLREEDLFENLGKTRAVLEQDDQALTVSVTLVLAAPEKPRKPDPGTG